MLPSLLCDDVMVFIFNEGELLFAYLNKTFEYVFK